MERPYPPIAANISGRERLTPASAADAARTVFVGPGIASTAAAAAANISKFDIGIVHLPSGVCALGHSPLSIFESIVASICGSRQGRLTEKVTEVGRGHFKTVLIYP
jgi:hypothetical protein